MKDYKNPSFKIDLCSCYKVRYLFCMNLILVLLLSVLSVNAQTTEADKVKQYEFEADKFWGVDSYNNIYYSIDNVFFKRNINDTIATQQFKDFNLGTLSSVDIINPLSILLFYKESNAAVFLDNRLNELNRYSFNQIRPLRTISNAKLAGNRHLWLFNVDTQRLEVFDLSKNETTSLSIPINKKVIQLETSFRNAWLVLPDSIKKYDWYANHVKTYTGSFEKISSDNGQILALTNDGNYYINRNGDDFEKLNNIKEVSNSFYFIGQKLYIYELNNLYVYRITSKS